MLNLIDSDINLVNFFLFFILLLARNLTEEERKGYKEITWDDKEVCAFYMVRFCPHDLFVNTRSDLGELKFIIFISFEVLFGCWENIGKEKEKKRLNL